MLQQEVEVLRCATSARVNSLTVEEGDGDAVGVGDGVGVGVGVGDGVGVGVGLDVGEGVGVGLGVGVDVVVGVATEVGETTGVGVAVGALRTKTPLLQTLLLPRLTQVNSRPLLITTVPTFLHVVPARGVTADALFNELATNSEESRRTIGRRTREF